MNRFENVVPFPKNRVAGSASIKLFIVFFYLFLAYLMTFYLRLSETGLTVLIALGLAYNFFVRKRFHGQHYIKKNWPLLAIIGLLLMVVFKVTMVLVGLVGIMYWILVGRYRTEAPYFLKFHLLTALISSFFILMTYLILSPIAWLIESLRHMTQMDGVLLPLQSLFGYLGLVAMVLFWGLAGYLSVATIRGKTPDLGVITNNARYWV
jgi:hypothetical protein